MVFSAEDLALLDCTAPQPVSSLLIFVTRPEIVPPSSLVATYVKQQLTCFPNHGIESSDSQVIQPGSVQVEFILWPLSVSVRPTA